MYLGFTGASTSSIRWRLGVHCILWFTSRCHQKRLWIPKAKTCGICLTCQSTLKDLGRDYDAVIRVNSQSGKGGIAYLLESSYNVVLPRRLQIEFSQAVQQVTDEQAKEVTAQDIWALFKENYAAAKDAHYSVKKLSLVGWKWLSSDCTWYEVNGETQIIARWRQWSNFCHSKCTSVADWRIKLWGT